MIKLTSLLAVIALALLAGCGKSDSPGGSAGGSGGRQITVALMPKSKGNAYFVS